MGVPYEMPPMGGLKVQGGSGGCFALPFPSRAIISKIVIIQTQGAIVSFTAALFNSEQACGGVPMSDSIPPDTGSLPDDLYRVTPDLSGTTGKLIYFSDAATGGHGFSFVNQEKSGPKAHLGNMRQVYLRLNPQGSGEMEFAVCLGGEIFD